MFTLKIKTDNAAFDSNDMCEVARILRVVASNLENGEDHGRCIDFNGNSVGEFRIDPQFRDRPDAIKKREFKANSKKVRA